MQNDEHKQVCELDGDCQQPATHIYYIRNSRRKDAYEPRTWACEKHLNGFIRMLGDLRRHVHVVDLRQQEFPF